MPDKKYYALNKNKLIDYSRQYYDKNKEQILNSAKAKKEYLRTNKRCTKCQRQDAYTLNGRLLCAECAQKANEYNKSKRDKAKAAERQKSNYNLLKEKGICTRCGKRKAENGITVCSICREKLRQMRSDERRKKGIFPKGESGYCARCNKEKAIEGKKVCKSCYDYLYKHIKSISHNTINHKWRDYNNMMFNKGA